ncbi:MAG TPA: hypothetical protein VFB81_12345, partial [Myxococcales bacterium]|nr:hypothetical protein [Myxococcales bacterium]
MATFPDLAIDRSGVGYSLVASSGLLAGASSGAFDVRAGAPTQLVFLGGSQATVAGACSPPLSVQSQDALANPVLMA